MFLTNKDTLMSCVNHTAYPFIVYDSQSDSYKVVDETAAYVSTLMKKDKAMRVFAIAGLYRTGKSALLRVMFGCNFTSTPSTNSCTKGLWIAYSPEHNLLIIDTEGLGSSDTPCDKHDSIILALAIMLCSTFCYNSIGTIDDIAIGTIATTLEISKFIHTTKEIEFPNFVWLLRDFSLEMETTNGKCQTATEYLDSVLRVSALHDSGKRNQRQIILDLFEDRSCMTLMRPCDRDDDLQTLVRTRSGFNEGVARVKQHILSNTKCLRRNNTLITPMLFVALATKYVTSINANPVPDISDVWGLVCREHDFKVVRAAVREFEDGIHVVEGKSTSEYRRLMYDKVHHIVMMLLPRLLTQSNIGHAFTELSRAMDRMGKASLAQINSILQHDLSIVEQKALLISKASDVKKLYDPLLADMEPGVVIISDSLWRAIPRHYSDRIYELQEQVRCEGTATSALKEKVATLATEMMALRSAAVTFKASSQQHDITKRRYLEASKKLTASNELIESMRDEISNLQEDLKGSINSMREGGTNPGKSDKSLVLAAKIARLLEELSQSKEAITRSKQVENSLTNKLTSMKAQLNSNNDALKRLEQCDLTIQQLREEATAATRMLEMQEERLLQEAKQVQEDALASVTHLNAILQKQRASGEAQRDRYKLSLHAAAEREKQQVVAATKLQAAIDTLQLEIKESSRREQGLTNELKVREESASQVQTHQHKTLRAYAQQISDSERERSRREIDAIRKQQVLKDAHIKAIQKYELCAVRMEAKVRSETSRRVSLEKDVSSLQSQVDGSAEQAEFSELMRVQRDTARTQLADAVKERDTARRALKHAMDDIKTRSRVHAAEIKRREMRHIMETTSLHHQLQEIRNLDM